MIFTSPAEPSAKPVARRDRSAPKTAAHQKMSASPPKQPVRRKHITTACTACRESKIKCDGSRPRCGNCKVRVKDCIYQQGEDKRSISLRKAVKVFSSRLSQLETFIRDHGLELPAMNAEDAALIDRLVDTLQPPQNQKGSKRANGNNVQQAQIMGPPPIPATNGVVPDVHRNQSSPEEDYSPKKVLEAQELHTDLTAFRPPNPYDLTPSTGHFSAEFMELDQMSGFNFDFSDWTTDFSGMSPVPFAMTNSWDELRYPYPQLDFTRIEVPTADAFGEPEFTEDSDSEGSIHSDDEGRDDVIQQISERMGSLQLSEDGELRYFGATSNLTLLDDVSPVDHWHEADIQRARGLALIDAAGVGKEVDDELIDHLISLYFAWQDPTFHVLDRDFYEQERKKYNLGHRDSSFYSETLTNTICAFGALYDTRRHTDFPMAVSDFFAKRAKIWLDIELDSPKVATVQALVILSSFEAAATRDARGWLYSGMAMRLSFDLGLHVDMTPYVKNGRMSMEEAEVRRIAFWGSFVVDHLWGFYLGRPPFRINTDEPSVQKPTGRRDGARKWIPYGLSPTLQETLPPIDNLMDCTELVTRQWVLLCEIMSQLSRVLYERVDVSTSVLRSLADSTITKLEAWKQNLPREMRVDLNDPNAVCLPHVLVLHMQYYQFLIYIHRPFVSRHSQPSAPNDPRYIHARRACIDAAVAISSLLRIYKSAYSLRYINVEVVSIIFSAAIIFVFASVSELGGNDNANLVSHLDTCCKALAELGKVFQNATRTLEVLLDIKRKWQAKVLASTGSKRRMSAVGKGSNAGKKRRKSHLVQPWGGQEKQGLAQSF